MNEYMINDFTGTLTNSDVLLDDIKIIIGETPIKAVRNAFKAYGKIRKARAFENPDIIIYSIKRNGNRVSLTSGQLCYMLIKEV